MATIALIKEAILALKDRTGSSIPAINKWIETEKKVSSKSRSFGRKGAIGFVLEFFFLFDTKVQPNGRWGIGILPPLPPDERWREAIQSMHWVLGVPGTRLESGPTTYCRVLAEIPLRTFSGTKRT